MNRYAWQLLFMLVLLAAIAAGRNLTKGSPKASSVGLGTAFASTASGTGGVLGMAVAQTACLQNPGLNDWMTFDTGSGAYTFTGCNPGEFTLSGTGIVKTVNGVAVLSDTKPDRRVLAFFNLGQGGGHATVTQISAPGLFHTLSINSAPNQTCVCHP